MTAAGAAKRLDELTADWKAWGKLLASCHGRARTRREQDLIDDMEIRFLRAGAKMWLTQDQFDKIKSIGER